MPFTGYFHVRFLLSAFPLYLFFSDRVRFRFGLIWLRVSCDHG